MSNDSKITTDLAVDDPLIQNAGFRFSPGDRQFIDQQARGAQQHLVNALIRGRHATFIRVHGASASLEAGDCVCLSSEESEPEVTKCTVGALADAIAPFGVVVYPAAPGAFALVAFGGVLPPSITGLVVNNKGFVRVDTSTGRCERVVALGSGDYGIGVLSNSGNMQVVAGVGVANTIGAFLGPGGSVGDIQIHGVGDVFDGLAVLDANRGGTGMTNASLAGNSGKAVIVNPGADGYSLVDLPGSSSETFTTSTSGPETVTAHTLDVSGFADGIYDYTAIVNARVTDGSNGGEFQRRLAFRMLAGVVAEAYPEVREYTGGSLSSPIGADVAITHASTTIKVDVTSTESVADINWNGSIGPTSAIGGGGSDGQSDLLTADTWNWIPAAYSSTSAKSSQKSITVTDNTEASVIELTQPDGTLVDYTATIVARNNYAESYMVDLRATYQKSSGITTEVRNLSPANEFNAWARAYIENVSDLIRVRFIGPNGKTTKVSCILSAQQILLNGIVPTWDMTAQPWTMWLSAAYGGAPYTGRASAGTSGSVNLTHGSTPATVGPESVAGNGLTAAHFDGLSKQLTTVSGAVHMSDLLDATGTGSFAIALLYSANSTSGLGPKFLEDSAGAQILSIRNDPAGVGIRRWDGIAYQEVLIPATLHTKHALVCQYDSGTSTLMARLDDGDWFTTTSAGLCDLTARPVGIGTHGLDADIWELATLKNATLSQFDADGFLFWCNTYHGTAFAP